MKKNLYTLLLLLFSAHLLFASNFTPGNIVVVRVGDGTAALSSTATAVFLDEYTTSGTLVQSVALPTAANGNNHILTTSGTATSEGSLTLSVNGQLLVLTGYDAAPGLAAVSSDSTTNRTIATVSSTGNVNTTTGFLAGSAFKKNNIRGAVTQDGTAFWCSGAGSSGTGGTWYTVAGSFTNAGVDISSTISSTRAINIFGGQLYTSSGSSSFHGVNSVGTGLPATSGQTSVNLAGMPGSDTSSSAYGFFIAGGNVMYVCDDHIGSTGGVLKYSLVSGNWVPNGNISSAAGLRSVVGYTTCTGVVLYVSGQGGVYTLNDNSGFNQTITGSLNPIVTPATNTVIRGIAFAPGTVAPGSLSGNTSIANITCNGEANGSVTTSITGGTVPYSYNWSNGSTTANISNLAPGSYTVTVNDAGGCSITITSAAITQPLALNVSATATAVTCNGEANGTVNLTVSGGTSAYSFNWSNGATTQNLASVSSATYTVTVTDNHNCTTTATASVSQPSAISIVPTVTNLPCTGGANTGAVNIAVTGGASGYTYSWSNSVTTQNITGLNAGNFTVTVTDASHCTAVQSAIVSQSGSLTLAESVTKVLCHGQASGGITVTASGGTPGYNYAWSTGNNNVPQTGLSAGSYIVTVTDQGGCTLINSINVTQPAALTAVTSPSNVACYAGTNGTLNLSVSGGTNPYTFHWSNGFTTESLNEVPAASYSVTVTDSNSCTATVSGVVSQPDSISVIAAITNATAFGDADGAILLTVTGGTPTYTYSWTSGSGNDNTQLAAGQYCVTVTDAHNCTSDDCYTITQPTGISQIILSGSFNVYPTGNLLVVNASLTTPQNCVLQMRDITGRMVYSNECGVTSLIQIQIPVSSLSPGCYVVTLNSTEGVASKKVIVTR